MEIIEFIQMLLFGGADTLQSGETVKAFVWLPAAIGALSSAGSAMMSSKANRKNERKIKAMENENRADYLREYYRGALDNEGSRAYLKKLDERMKRSDRAAENALTASGATHENALAVKQANNETYSDAVANLVENEQARKDTVRADYKEGKNAIAQAQMQQNANEAATWSQVGNAISSAAGALGEAGAFDKTNPLAVGTGTSQTSHLPKPQLPKQEVKVEKPW